jgi:hypothetical protein
MDGLLKDDYRPALAKACKKKTSQQRLEARVDSLHRKVDAIQDSLDRIEQDIIVRNERKRNLLIRTNKPFKFQADTSEKK